MSRQPNPIVHLELRTGNLPRACNFYSRLFGWRAEPFNAGRETYLTLELGDRVDGGVVERDTERSLWLPYVEVDEVRRATDAAVEMGANVLISPREGPAGWRSVVAAPSGAEVALWQQKR